MGDLTREQAFVLTYKVGMINLWRKRCTEHNQMCGKKVNPSDCKTCNEVAKEIVEDIKECARLRAFKE